MTRLAGALALLGLLALAGGYLGALHPAGDSLAVFRPLLAGAVMLLALPILVARRWIAGGLAMGLALAALGEFVLVRVAPPPPGPVTVYQKNLWYGNEAIPALVEDILAHRPDAVFLQEVTDETAEALRLLEATHPTQHRCPYIAIGDPAIAARPPAIAGTARCERGMAIVRVSAPEGPLWLVSMHLPWPWPYGQAERIARAEAILAGLDGPMVVGGDLNMVAWSHGVRRLAGTAGARPVRPAPMTLRIGGLVPIAIDHVLATGPGRAEPRPLLGSDHHGVVARVAPFARARPASPGPPDAPAGAVAGGTRSGPGG